VERWVRVARLDEIPRDGGRAFEIDGLTIGVYRCGETLFAICDVCTHALALLHEGSVDRVRCTVSCPLHGAEFDLATGAVLSPPATEPIRVYPVRVAGDDVEVALPGAS